jgi:hypothetical protein
MTELECEAGVTVDVNFRGSGGMLFCSLPDDHGGEWHYDDVDDVSWKRGRP